MKQFYVTYDNDDGQSLDTLVQADTPERAKEVFRDHWIEEGLLEEDAFPGLMHDGSPPSRGPQDFLRVFEIITHNPHREGVFPWTRSKQDHTNQLHLAGFAYIGGEPS